MSSDRGRMIALRVAPERLRALEPLAAECVFADAAGPRAVIMPPRQGPGREVADACAAAFRRRWNLDLPVLQDDARPPVAGTIVAFGHPGNHRLLERLHDYYRLPGGEYPLGGFHVRSFHRVFGTEANLVLVAGRRGPVLRRGLERLLDALRQSASGRPVLPEAAAFFPPDESEPAPEAFVRAESARVRERRGGRPTGFLAALERLRRTGNPAWGRAFLRLLAPYANGEIPLSFGLMSAVDFWTDQLALTWEVVEPLSCFSDADRLMVANFIAACTEYCHDSITYQKWRIVPEDHQVFNHHTFPARGLFFGTRFLAARSAEPLPMLEEWTAKALGVFDRAATAGRSFDEGGSGYSWLVGTHLLDVALARGDRAYARSERLKHYTDLAVMVQNSRFEMVPFGDCSSYHARGGDTAELLLHAARWRRDGGCKWVARQAAPERVAADPFSIGLRARPPAEHLGLKILPMDPVIHRWSGRPAFPGYPPPLRLPNVPPENGFDKITLRGGWTPDDDYLLLQGFGSGQHGHPDANAVSQYQVRKRLFLVDCDYIRRAPAQHNTVMIVADGEHLPPPITARLDEAVEFAGGALTRTSLLDYNGCDWQRTLIWLAGEYVLVIDAIHPRRESELDLRCYWRTLGTVSATPAGMRAEHADETFHVLELTRDASEHHLAVEPPPLSATAYPQYEFGDGRPVVLRQRRQFRGTPGQAAVFVNLLAPSGTSPHPLHVGSLDENRVIVRRPGLRLEVTSTAIRRNGILLHRFAAPLPLPRPKTAPHSPPVRPTLPAAPRLRVLWQRKLPAPPSCLGPGDAGLLVGTEAGHVLRITPAGKCLAFTRIDCRVNALLEARLYGEATPVVLVTGARETLEVFDRNGERRLRVSLPANSHMPAHGRALVAADLDGDGRLTPVVGTRAWRVHALEPDGRFRWTFETAAHAVNCLAAGDLNGDGRDEIAVGTVYFCVPAIDARGRRLWEDEDYNDFWRGGPDFHFVRILDLDGDGRAEVLAAGADTFIHCIDNRGGKKWTASIGDECAGLIAGPDDIRAASRDGSVHFLDRRGRRTARRMLGSECTCLAEIADRTAAGTADNAVVLLNRRGDILAAHPLEGTPRYLAPLGDGILLVIDDLGTATALV